jgi:hypothetical protein
MRRDAAFMRLDGGRDDSAVAFRAAAFAATIGKIEGVRGSRCAIAKPRR